MYRCVIYFIVNINLFVQSDPFFENNYNIKINKKISNYGINYNLNETFVVFLDKPFNITFVDYASAGVICRGKDKPNSLTWHVELIMVDGKWNSVIKVQKAEKYMSTEWKCTFGRINEPAQVVTFNIRVKGKPKIKVTVGGVELNNSLSESTELDYDNIAYYWYEDGESIDLVCHQLDVGFLYIVYYDQYGTILVKTDRMSRQKPPNFQKIMHASDNNYIIDCKYDLKISNFYHGYAYRTIFKLRPEASMLNIITEQDDSLDVRMQKKNLLEEYKDEGSTDGFDEALASFKNRNGPVQFQRVYGTKIIVNNLKLIPRSISAHLDKEEYLYKFFDGQILNVTCEKNKDLPGYLNFGTENNERLKSRILEETSTDLWKKTITLDTKNMTLEHLRCEVIGYTTANIMLALDPKELHVIGLPINNVMYQYRNNNSTWIVDYQYSVGETLSLACGARTKSNLRLIFRSADARSEALMRSRKILRRTLTMRAGHNEMKIICEEESGAAMKVIVNLHLLENEKEEILFTIAPIVYSDRSDTVKTYAVYENQPFSITILNYYASEARCYRHYNGLYDFPTKLENIEEENQFNSVIMVSSASKDMSTIWACTLTKEVSLTQDVIFGIHVIGINNLNVTVGGIELKPVALNSSDEVSNAVSHYWYEAGEAIDFECVNRHVGGTIQLKYYNTNCLKLVETDQLWQVPISFRKTMHVSNDGDNIDCIYQTEYYIYTHRTFFKLKNESSSKRVIGVHVNDFLLVPTVISDGNMSIYEYKYNEGEILMVSCEKDKSAPGYVQYETNDIEVPECNNCYQDELQAQSLMSNKNIIKLNTKHLNEKHLICNLTSNELSLVADIRFLAETNQLYIIGLPMSDMIIQYKKNMSTWVLDYNCVEEQVVHLMCVAIAESNMRWIFTNSSGESYNETTSISHKFALRPEVDVMTITCEATDVKTLYLQSVIVNLHSVRKSSKTPGTSQDPVTCTNPHESLNFNVIVIIGLSAAALASLVGISIAIWMCKKRKKKGDTQNTTSSNPQSRPLPEVPREREPLYSYDYAYSSSHYADLNETRNQNRNQQNTMYYWAF